MTDKQMEERIDEVIEFIRQTLLEFHEYGEDENEAKDYAEDCREKIEKLVEEVEREAMKEGWNRAVLTVNDAEQERLKYLKKWLPIKAKEIETN